MHQPPGFTMAHLPGRSLIENLVAGMYAHKMRKAMIPHTCTERCTFRKMDTVYVRWRNGVHLCCPSICEDEPMICPFRARVPGHPPALTMRDVHTAVNTRQGSVNGCTFTLIPSVYVCVKSGQVHMCGPACTLRTIDDGSMHRDDVVCPLTKQQFDMAGQSEQYHIVAALHKKSTSRIDQYTPSATLYNQCMDDIFRHTSHVVAWNGPHYVFIGLPPLTRMVDDTDAADAVAATLKAGERCMQSAAFAVTLCVLSNRLRAATEMRHIRESQRVGMSRMIKAYATENIGSRSDGMLMDLGDAFALMEKCNKMIPHGACAVEASRFLDACMEIASHITMIYDFIRRNDEWNAGAERYGIRLNRKVTNHTYIAAGILVLLKEDLEYNNVRISRSVDVLKRIIPDDNLQSCGILCTGVTKVMSEYKKVSMSLTSNGAAWPTHVLDSDPRPLNDRLRSILWP